MRRALWLTAIAAVPGTAVAQLPSGVYSWAELPVAAGPVGDVRSILEGSTTDLAYLRVRAVTLPPGASMSTADGNHSLEMLLIVKAGELDVTLHNQHTTLGARGVAVIVPDDDYHLANAGSAPVTYYEFTYRSRAPVDSARAQAAGGSFTVRWDDLEYQETETGGRWQPFDRPTAMLSRFEMHVTSLRTGLATHQPHTHRAEEMVLMLRGDASMVIGGGHYAAATGDLVFLASQVPHALDNTGDGPAEYFAFQWR